MRVLLDSLRVLRLLAFVLFVAVSSDGRQLWAADRGDGTVSRIDIDEERVALALGLLILGTVTLLRWTSSGTRSGGRDGTRRARA